ncbi:beta-galactosidase [Aequitasia blattaphilus]|uniref:beta-galactosidase n=1 Tax=Aequitasia blattaphilus TaxID=2949332 RepID=A0ABT1E9L9_9FIRM|nr:beta-galactosidase small subunit [Aequitasia blattaphilus]MCP1102483.1 beta-galactosidase small subunit [Aequitasia blattaphilus]MCR8615123.1 beta-galactosidase small subunit [Aequitasia blattaphilus]
MENINKELSIIYGDVTLGLKGDDFHYIFSYAKGGLESLKKQGQEWLYRIPMPTFWRATTDNDRGNGFSYASAMWMGADMFLRCISKYVKINGEEIPFPAAPENNKYSNNENAKEVEITFIYETSTVPKTSVSVSYTVLPSGEIKIHMHYKGKDNLPGLPVLGMRFVLMEKADGYKYEGLSGETYPDRMEGGAYGVHQVEGLPVTPYLVPQECGMHMKTRWAEVERNNQSIKFRGKDEFAFSCLPYTSQELENATHMEELPLPRRTVMVIANKVRGVGGIDSWGSKPGKDYEIPGDQDYTLQFSVK